MLDQLLLAEKVERNVSTFESAFGFYDVVYTKPVKSNENPVGGKWTRKNGIAQRFLRTTRSMQHLLPPKRSGAVAEAVNVVMLDSILFGNVTVILRGDAYALNETERNAENNYQPLSARAVKATFDPPRIAFRHRRWNISIGPKSSVLLDTPYLDDKMRVGIGGRSGTKFIFRRVQDDDAKAFAEMIAVRPLAKHKILAVLSAVVAGGLHSAWWRSNVMLKLIGGCVSVIAAMIAILVSTSSGGIENDRE